MIEDSTKIIINKNTIPGQKMFNASTSDEVAGIWVDRSVGSSIGGPHILVHGKSNQSHRIKHYYECYDPLQYPLIFPSGDCGWHPGLKKIIQNIRAPYVPSVIEDADANIEQFLLSAEATGLFASLVSVIQRLLQLMDHHYSYEILQTYLNSLLFLCLFVHAYPRKHQIQCLTSFFVGKTAPLDNEPLEHDSKRVSCREYYPYKLQMRATDYTYPLRMGCLF